MIERCSSSQRLCETTTMADIMVQHGITMNIYQHINISQHLIFSSPVLQVFLTFVPRVEARFSMFCSAHFSFCSLGGDGAEKSGPPADPVTGLGMLTWDKE